jgi:hypothetical protein
MFVAFFNFASGSWNFQFVPLRRQFELSHGYFVPRRGQFERTFFSFVPFDFQFDLQFDFSILISLHGNRL